jgi:hypothetical protein
MRQMTKITLAYELLEHGMSKERIAERLGRGRERRGFPVLHHRYVRRRQLDGVAVLVPAVRVIDNLCKKRAGKIPALF